MRRREVVALLGNGTLAWPLLAYAQQGARQIGVVLPNAVTTSNRERVFALALQYQLPAVYSYPYIGREGGLVSYGPDQPAQFREAAHYVDRILRGARPGDLPVQFPTGLLSS